MGSKLIKHMLYLVGVAVHSRFVRTERLDPRIPCLCLIYLFRLSRGRVCVAVACGRKVRDVLKDLVIWIKRFVAVINRLSWQGSKDLWGYPSSNRHSGDKVMPPEELRFSSLTRLKFTLSCMFHRDHLHNCSSSYSIILCWVCENDCFCNNRSTS